MHRSLFSLVALVSSLSLSLAAFGCSTNGTDDEEDDVDAVGDALDDGAAADDDSDSASGDHADDSDDGDHAADDCPCADGTSDCAPCEDPSVPPCDPADPNCAQPPPAGECEQVAAMLAALLVEVRSCSILDAADACSIVVDTTHGCPIPANAQSPRLGEYKELFGKYAESCPLPVPACPVPAAMACMQAPDVDSTIGVCEVIPDDASDPE